MNPLCASLAVVLCLAAGTFVRAAVAQASADADDEIQSIVVTARHRVEEARVVPVSLSVVSGETLDATNTFTMSQLTQLIPSLNYTSPNPRNTALTIRGLGSSVVAIAQANDGLEPGVGFYVDQVYHARPATAAFDFLDLERVEVLRGPQGSLFGKNTTAGAMNISTRAPSFQRELRTEVTGGTHDYQQAKFAASGPLLGEQLAGRISLLSTQREGVIDNVLTGKQHNDVDSRALRAQLLYAPDANLQLRLSADFSAVDSNCCTQVYFNTGTSLLAADRQFAALAARQNYRLPSLDPYDRLTDIDASLKVSSHEGGLAAIAEWQRDNVVLTSVSAWRYWQWDAANDRDYTSLSIQTLQQIPSRQDQYSQEFRLASSGERALDYTAGVYYFTQTIKGKPVTAYGPIAAAWLLRNAPNNLLDGYRTDGRTRFVSDSYAAFGELTWHVSPRLELTTGVRYTYEEKSGSFQSAVSGGLVTTDPVLLQQKLSILRPQSYAENLTDGSFTSRASLSWHLTTQAMTYVSVAQGYKSGGINMSGLPLTANNQPALTTAVIAPEQNVTAELGIKAEMWGQRLLLNADVFKTTVKDFQANVIDTGPGALRGYLANIERVQVQGLELDGTLLLTQNLSVNFSGALTDGKYVSYRNAPCPLERVSSPVRQCDLSGEPLSSLPQRVVSGRIDYQRPVLLAGLGGNFFARLDFTKRSSISGEPSNSRYTRIDGYSLVNGSVGLADAGPWEVSLWARNLLQEDYMQMVTVQAGNSGLIVGMPSDPALVGLTLKFAL